MTLSIYEERAAREIIERRQKQAAKPVGRITSAVEKAGKQAVGATCRLPRGEEAIALATAAYEQAVKGLAKATVASARLTTSPKTVLRRYARHDSSVTTFAGVRTLDLEVIDQVRPRASAHLHAIGAGLEGGLTGLAMSGGAILAGGGALLGAGAGAAPGFGVAAGAFAADTATVLVTSTRLALQIGSYYGYDPRDEGEHVFGGAVVNLATAGGTAARSAAYTDLFRLTQMLARRATWQQLNSSALVRLLRPMFGRLALRLTKQKLGQIVPAAGIAIGAGMNYAMIDRVGETAHWAYRERLLRDKGYEFPDFTPVTPSEPEPNDDVVISLDSLADDEGVELPD